MKRSYSNVVLRRASGLIQTWPQPQLSRLVTTKPWASHLSLRSPTGIAVCGWHELVCLKYFSTQCQVYSEDLLNVTALPSHCGGITVPNPEYRGSYYGHQTGVFPGLLGGLYSQHDLTSLYWESCWLIANSVPPWSEKSEISILWHLSLIWWPGMVFLGEHSTCPWSTTHQVGGVLYTNLLGQDGWECLSDLLHSDFLSCYSTNYRERNVTMPGYNEELSLSLHVFV